MSQLLSRVVVLVVVFICLIFIVSGCGSEPAPEPEETVAADTEEPGPTSTRRITTPVPFVSIDSAAAEVRDGPDRAFESIGFARNGQALRVLGTDEDGAWYNVALGNGDFGWIHKSFISKDDWIAQPIIAMTIPPFPLTQTAMAPTVTVRPTRTTAPTRTAKPTSTNPPQPTSTSQPVVVNTSPPVSTDTAVPVAPTNTVEIVLPTNTLPPPTEAPPAAPCSCSGNTLNCGDFSTHSQAQACFNYCFPIAGDIHGLDSDGDGGACESLP